VGGRNLAIRRRQLVRLNLGCGLTGLEGQGKEVLELEGALPGAALDIAVRKSV
jgi:hypothetical protein